MAPCRRACNCACVVGLARPDALPTEPAGVCADEENAVVVASKKVIESFAMFKVGLLRICPFPRSSRRGDWQPERPAVPALTQTEDDRSAICHRRSPSSHTTQGKPS